MEHAAQARPSYLLPGHRELEVRLQKHIEVVYENNFKLIRWEHPVRVAEITGKMAIHRGLPEYKCFKAVEGALLHDVGKLDPEAVIWLETNRGRKVTEDQRSYFRELHSKRGRTVLEKHGNFAGMWGTLDEMGWVCEMHHVWCSEVRGELADALGLISVADYFHARTWGEGDHGYNLISKPKAAGKLMDLCACRRFDLGSVQSLIFCEGLTES